MKVSIIIPTYGRPSVINECLKSIDLIKSEIPKPYEIIVVNNNNDKIRKSTSKLLKKFKIVEVKSKPLGSVKARNLGIKKSKGQILIFFDDDTLIQKNYFKNLLKHYNDKSVGAVGGCEIKSQKNTIFHKILFALNKPGSITWSGNIISNFSQHYPNNIQVKHLHGSNFSIRKSIIKKIGLMDEKMEGHYRDETEFIYRVYKNNYNVIFEPKARVIHTATNIGGNVSPENKKKWAYWYHKNTKYFFYKHLYNGNNLKLLCFNIRELLTSIIRVIIYKNIYYLIQ